MLLRLPSYAAYDAAATLRRARHASILMPSFSMPLPRALDLQRLLLLPLTLIIDAGGMPPCAVAADVAPPLFRYV